MMRDISNEKIKDLMQFMINKGIDALFIVDLVDVVNDPNLKYLSGHPNNAALVVERSGRMTLFPLDLSLAEEHAEVESIADLRPIDFDWKLAVYEFFREHFPEEKPIVGINDFLPDNLFQEIASLRSIQLYENSSEITNFLETLRAM